MKVKKFYWKFETGTWLKDPAVTGLSPVARAAWFDLLCHMFEDGESGVVKGNIDTLARLARVTPEQMKAAISEFETCRTCVASRARTGIVTLKNRRMFAEAKMRIDAAKRQRNKRGAKRRAEDVTPMSRESHAPNVTLELNSNTRALKRNVSNYSVNGVEHGANGKPANGTERFGIAQVDWGLAKTLARRLFRKLPLPKHTSPEQKKIDSETYMRLAVLAASRFSEDWLVDGIEAVLANRSRKSPVAHLQGVLNNKLAAHGTKLTLEFKRVSLPDSFVAEVFDMTTEDDHELATDRN